MDGPPRMVAWQPGQVGNEAAIPKYYQCRGSGSSLFPIDANELIVLLFVKYSEKYPKQTFEGQIGNPQDRDRHEHARAKLNTEYFGSIVSEFD